MRKTILAGGVQILCALTLFLFAVFLVRDMKQDIPASVEVYEEQGYDFTLKDVEKISKQGGFVAGGRCKKVRVDNLHDAREIYAYYQPVTENFKSLSGLSLKEGELQGVVIPECLVSCLVQDGEQKGITLDGVLCQVGGVYEEGNLCVQLGSIHNPVIYGAGSQDLEQQVAFVRIPVGKGEATEQKVQEASYQLQTALTGEVRNYYRFYELADSLLMLWVFFASLWFVFGLCGLAYRKIIKGYEEKQDLRKRWSDVMMGGILFGFAMVVFGFVLQCVQIPNCYLPPDQIFDISFYIENIVDGIQRMNGSYRVVDFTRISVVYLLAEGAMLVPGIVIFWNGCNRMLRKE